MLSVHTKINDINCDDWTSHHWSFMVREDGCISQDWHMDDEHGHFCIFPIYPCGDRVKSDGNYPSMQEENWDDYYDVCVIPGTHKIPFKKSGMEVSIEKYKGEVLRLHLEVGQVLVACANLVHCGGPSANVSDMMGTERGLDPKTVNGVSGGIGAFKNLSIHGYLRNNQQTTMAGNDKVGEATYSPTFV